MSRRVSVQEVSVQGVSVRQSLPEGSLSRGLSIGGGGSVRDTLPYGEERTVHILLECILVCMYVCM